MKNAKQNKFGQIDETRIPVWGFLAKIEFDLADPKLPSIMREEFELMAAFLKAKYTDANVIMDEIEEHRWFGVARRLNEGDEEGENINITIEYYKFTTEDLTANKEYYLQAKKQTI